MPKVRDFTLPSISEALRFLYSPSDIAKREEVRGLSDIMGERAKRFLTNPPPATFGTDEPKWIAETVEKFDPFMMAGIRRSFLGRPVMGIPKTRGNPNIAEEFSEPLTGLFRAYHAGPASKVPLTPEMLRDPTKGTGGIHVGTMQAAQERVRATAGSMDRPNYTPRQLLEIIFESKNPALPRHFHTGFKQPAKLFTEYSTAGPNPDVAIFAVKDAMARGEATHDVIPYINSVEHPGSLSFAIMDPKAIRSIRPMTKGWLAEGSLRKGSKEPMYFDVHAKPKYTSKASEGETFETSIIPVTHGSSKGDIAWAWKVPKEFSVSGMFDAKPFNISQEVLDETLENFQITYANKFHKWPTLGDIQEYITTHKVMVEPPKTTGISITKGGPKTQVPTKMAEEFAPTEASITNKTDVLHDYVTTYKEYHGGTYPSLKEMDDFLSETLGDYHLIYGKDPTKGDLEHFMKWGVWKIDQPKTLDQFEESYKALKGKYPNLKELIKAGKKKLFHWAIE